jgi:hypothetical protein|tara:strand:+ start:3147 stop:3326 length:180 start_codon:yes stop_codon:yes gene_type:complete
MFSNWISINLFFDISLFVFVGFCILQNYKLRKKLKIIEEQLLQTIKNPAMAKRKLKHRP